MTTMNTTTVPTITTTPTVGANRMMRELFEGQMMAMTTELATKFNVEEEAAQELCATHCVNVDIMKLTKGKKSRGRRKPKAPIAAENRCMCRVWGDGQGVSQCKSAKSLDTDYCKRCSKKAEICDKPCQLDSNGKRLGLFCGRIDQFEPGTNLPPFSCGDEIRIIWKDEGVRDAISSGFDDGKFTSYAHTAKKSKSNRKNSKAKVISENELASLVATSTDSEVAAVIDEEDSMNDVLQEFGLTPEEDEEETTLELEQWEHNGEDYLVERSTLLIYNEEGEVLSKWGEGDTINAPIPDDE